MTRIKEFLRRERLYFLLLIFIVLVNVTIIAPYSQKTKPAKVAASAKVVEDKSAKFEEDVFARKDGVEKVFRENRDLALLFNLISLLILAALLLGLAIDAIFAGYYFSGKRPQISTCQPPAGKWTPWDVSKVVILFLFFGYMLVLIESMLARTFPIIRNSDFRMIFNSSILDILAVIFILYFTIGQYKSRLVSLGINFKNFINNVFYGVVGYLATVPVLILTLVLTAVITNIIKYKPEQQPVVELFMKQTNPTLLFYTSIFAAIAGPIIEELFFRGFMYTAVKKYIGIFWATFITAAIFAVLHTNIVGFFPIMILGILLAYLYEKTGTLTSSITVHVIHNLSMVLFVFLIKQLKV